MTTFIVIILGIILLLYISCIIRDEIINNNYIRNLKLNHNDSILIDFEDFALLYENNSESIKLYDSFVLFYDFKHYYCLDDKKPTVNEALYFKSYKDLSKYLKWKNTYERLKLEEKRTLEKIEKNKRLNTIYNKYSNDEEQKIIWDHIKELNKN